MKKLRVVYMGTPDFAVPCLERIIADGHQVETVVTQPDRPRGRGQKVTYSPVKTAALAHGLTVLQPQTIKDPEFMASLCRFLNSLSVVISLQIYYLLPSWIRASFHEASFYFHPLFILSLKCLFWRFSFYFSKRRRRF